MAARARGRRSSHGIDGAILETSVGSIGTVLEAATRAARRRKAKVRNVASRAGAIEPRTTGTQEGFPRCRATFVADSYAQEVSVEVRSGAAAEPSGVSPGRGPYQVVQLGLRSVGPQCPAYAEGAG